MNRGKKGLLSNVSLSLARFRSLMPLVGTATVLSSSNYLHLTNASCRDEQDWRLFALCLCDAAIIIYYLVFSVFLFICVYVHFDFFLLGQCSENTVVRLLFFSCVRVRVFS